MLLSLLGTAASNAYPEPFCSCENCCRAWELGGRSLRRRSAALINDDLLIDLGPDIMTASHAFGLPLTKVRYVLQTHPHADHIDLSHLNSRSPAFGVVGAPRLQWFMTEETKQLARRTFQRDLSGYDLASSEGIEALNMTIETIRPLEQFSCGSYRITPLPANHAPGKGAVLYAVEEPELGVAVLYGTDTGVFFDEAWEGIQAHGLRFDVVILDHTYGPDGSGSGHMNAAEVADHVARMRRDDILKPDGRAVATHISHDENPVYPELAAIAESGGYEAGYDGMQIEIG